MSSFLKCSGRLLVTTSLLIISGCNNGDPPANSTDAPAADQPVKNGNVEVPLTTEDYRKAIRLKNRGIGHLENKEWTDAESALSELAQLLPRNRLALRNLAIGRVLALVDRESPYKRTGSPEDPEKFLQAIHAAKTAINSYREIATGKYDAALASLLMGRLLVHADSPETPSIEDGLQQLREAADAVPTASDFRFSLAMAMDGHRDYADANSQKSPQLLKALQQTFELAPQNLFALLKLMQRQALSLNSTNEETKQLALQITETMTAATKLLAPLNESIKKQRKMDLVKTIDRALIAFNGSNSATLMGPAMMTSNLLLPEIATQIDQRSLNKNLLEYLLFEFDEAFLTAADELRALPVPERTVVKAFRPTDWMPKITGVTQVELLDMNLDGFDDLVVAREGRIEVYSRGTDLAAEWTLMMTSPEAAIGLTEFLLADIDRDYDKAISDLKNPLLLRDSDGDQKIPSDPAGKNRWYDTDLDVIAWSKEGVVIFRNEISVDGVRSLSIVPQEEATPNVNDIVAADLEADGDLDLVFATDAGMTLWKNIDGTTFQNMNDSASLPEHGLQALVAVDWNRDVAIDVVGATTDGEVGYLQNIFHGRFRWIPNIPADSAVAKGDIRVAYEDADGYREIDVPVLQFGGDSLKLVQWASGSRIGEDFNHVGADPQNDRVRMHVRNLPSPFLEIADLDNDGRPEVLWQREHEVVAFRDGIYGKGSYQGSFDPQPSIPVLQDTKVSTLTTSDVDDDGDLDVVYVSAEDGSLGLLTNDGGNTNNWIDVVARAVPDDAQFPSNRVNMHGIGSVIEMRAGGLYHAEVISKPKIHLGLGKAKAADAIRIIWTDGIPQNVTVPDLLKPRVGILAPQILKGSCPYIYTWTGARFEFFSDCLWAAPIGLVQANGEIAPTREWENLLIPGEVLDEKDGRYLLQLTEELWETAYFDHVQLTAIDHPADVKVFTNEKVGPPDMAQHRIHTVKQPQLPVSVTDGRGNDLLPGLTAQDGDYIQAFHGRVMQGLTDEWTMEFDPGNLASAKNVRLFLLGWVFPTDTSLNLGIEQNPNLDPPAPPSIEVPDGHGGWKVARPFVGFPSGKTKAMVIDISDIFTGDDNRFRIKSSMELYWDQAFFTVDEEDAETVVQACDLMTGDLHFRGFSRRIYNDNALFRNGRAPEGYDYQSVSTEPRWPPVSGRFTRYGNATPLLSDHDDQLVVMGPGDELTVEFAVPGNPVPPGWKRDFVLTSVGLRQRRGSEYNLRSVVRTIPIPSDDSVSFCPGRSGSGLL